MIFIKRTLRFNENGKFKILMISDIQETMNYDFRTVKGMEAMIDIEKPDLVILGGDNCDGRKVKLKEELEEYLKIFTAPMENRSIPWIHVYGNHDYDIDVPVSEQNEIYCAYPNCISGRSPDGVPGVSNYATHILAHDSDRVAYCIYAFDTMHKNPEFRGGITTEELMVPERPKCYKKWDFIRFEQQMWYWNHSKELEKSEGHIVKALAFMHVPPHEMYLCINNPEETQLKGESEETLQCSVLNSGIFATMLQRGDVDIIAAGHLHKDTVDAVYGGIRLCLDGCAGFSPKSFDHCRGGRIFDINEDGTYTTRWIAVQDLIDITVKSNITFKK